MDSTNALQTVSEIDRAIVVAKTVEEIRHIEAAITGIESAMKSAGLYSTAEIRPYNEAKMRARRKLGELLAEIERGAGRKKNSDGARPNFKAYIKEIGLQKETAQTAQRIAAMPVPELEAALAERRESDTLATFADLLRLARPWWAKEQRERKHQQIAEDSRESGGLLGTFPLIYADPPWRFDV